MPRSPEHIRDTVTGKLTAWLSGVPHAQEALVMLPSMGQPMEHGGIAQISPCWFRHGQVVGGIGWVQSNFATAP